MNKLQIIRAGHLYGSSADVVVMLRKEALTEKQEAQLKAYIEKMMGKKVGK